MLDLPVTARKPGTGSKATPTDMAEATRKTQLDLLARYIASTDEARQVNLAKIRSSLELSIDSHLTEPKRPPR